MKEPIDLLKDMFQSLYDVGKKHFDNREFELSARYFERMMKFNEAISILEKAESNTGT